MTEKLNHGEIFTVVNEYDEDFRQRAAELREERRQRVRELREEGLSLRAIAERLGVDHGTVLRDLRATEQTPDSWLRSLANGGRPDPNQATAAEIFEHARRQAGQRLRAAADALNPREPDGTPRRASMDDMLRASARTGRGFQAPSAHPEADEYARYVARHQARG